MRKTSWTIVMVLFLAAIFLSLGGPRAMAEDPKNYLLLKLGAYSPQHDDLDYFDKGFNGELYYGKYFHKNFASEIGIGYFKSNGSKQLSPTILKEDSLKVIDILYTIKGVYPIGRLELFAGPGIGWYFVKANTIVTTAGVRVAGSDVKGAFGFHVLAGANFNITPEWFVGAEGKYFWAKTDVTIDTISAGFFGSHMDGLVGTASVGWRF